MREEENNKRSLSLRDNIILTGGHAASTAIAVIEEIQKRNKKWHLSWIGPESAFEGRKIETFAAKVMPKMGVTYYPITAGRIQKKFTIWTIPALLKIPIGILEATKIILKIKPEIIVSFGGYASVPVCFVGWILRIPIIIHEQTVAVGRANRLMAFFATKILLARKSSEDYFPKLKTMVIGNPVVANTVKVKPKNKIGRVPTIYITGGSSGAQRINTVISEILYELLKKYKVIHQTGKLDIDQFTRKREEFPSDLRKNYEVHEFISDVYKVFEKADMIISRAGANTISEIMIIKRPAILIPIPWTSYDEQTKNAKLAEEQGIGFMIKESDLSGESLLMKLDDMHKNWGKIVKNAKNEISDVDINASGKFVDEIEKLV